MAFDSIQLLPSVDPETLSRHTDDLCTIREARGLGFSSVHLRSLLRQSISQFCRGRLFSVYLASRLTNPVPENLATHIANFYHESGTSGLDAVPMIASALEFNAHPPQMHCTCPGPYLCLELSTNLYSLPSRSDI